MATRQEHLRTVACNLEVLAEEIGLLASDSDDECSCDHEFADELDSRVDCLMNFAGRVV